MYEEDFQKLKESVNVNDHLLKLRTFGDLLEKIYDYITETKNKSQEISFLTESIKKQKLIYDKCESISECLQDNTKAPIKKNVDDGNGLDAQEFDSIRLENEIADNKIKLELLVEQLKDSLNEFKSFVNEYGSSPQIKNSL